MTNKAPMTLHVEGTLRLREQLQLLALSSRDKRRILREMATAARRDARRNIRGQRTYNGATMAPRSQSRKRRKMLMGLGRTMGIQSINNTTMAVGWKNKSTGRIAAKHQHGHVDPWSSARAEKSYGTPDYNKPATKDQAKSLINEGYRRKVRKKKGKGYRLVRVSQKWIRENMTLGQAGIILRLMRTGKKRGKQSWQIRTPARPFLGASPAQVDKYMTSLARHALAKITN